MSTLTSIAVKSPKSLDRGLRRAGEIQTALAEANAEKSAAEAAVLETHQPGCTALQTALDEQCKSISAYLAANRDKILGDETSINVPGGTIAIHQRPEMVLIAKGQEKKILARLLKAKKEKFLTRPPAKLNRKALLDARPRLKDVSYGRSGESLFLTPVTSGDKLTLDLATS